MKRPSAESCEVTDTSPNPPSNLKPVRKVRNQTDIPPNRRKEELLVWKETVKTPGLECDETMDSCQVPLPIVDVEDDAFLEASPPRDKKGSNSFIREIHSVDAQDDFAPLEILEDEPDPDPGWSVKDQPYIYSLLEKETEYACNPFALQLSQPNISPMMRAILLDWMMEVCSEFTLKRESYYLSVNYVDRYLSSHPGVRKEEFQLLGLTCMFLAAKTEVRIRQEICNPKIADFARSADNGYSQGQIKAMEMTVLKTLSWRMFPPTVYNWASLTMTLWDDYIACIYSPVLSSTKPEAKTEEQTELAERLIQFKQPNQHSYKRFRETMQILDAAFLDVGALRYSPRQIVAGLLYLMISKYFYESDYRLFSPPESLKTPVPVEAISDSLTVCFGDGKQAVISAEEEKQETQLQNAKIVQDLFSAFTCKALELRNIEDIYPSVAFLHGFLEFEVRMELPVVCKILPKSKLESHYEDFLAFQTHNSNNVPFVSQRLKVDKSR